jgi:hypothetical protein
MEEISLVSYSLLFVVPVCLHTSVEWNGDAILGTEEWNKTFSFLMTGSLIAKEFCAVREAAC